MDIKNNFSKEEVVKSLIFEEDFKNYINSLIKEQEQFEEDLLFLEELEERNLNLISKLDEIKDFNLIREYDLDEEYIDFIEEEHIETHDEFYDDLYQEYNEIFYDMDMSLNSCYEIFISKEDKKEDSIDGVPNCFERGYYMDVK